jgi:hypothetical protein
MILSTLLLCIFAPTALSYAFTLDSDAPTQCEAVQVNWQGGTPPFYMTVMVSPGDHLQEVQEARISS